MPRSRTHSSSKRRSAFILASLGALALGLASGVSFAANDGAELPSLNWEPKTWVQALDRCSAVAPLLTGDECVERYFRPTLTLATSEGTAQLESEHGLSRAALRPMEQALTGSLRSELGNPSEEELKKLHAKYEHEFKKPLRIRVSRILLSSKEDALAVLKKITPDTSALEFRRLCRENSIDRATKERGGDLGFVWPDGNTDIPQVRTEKSLYEAVSSLENGEFAPTPIQEKDGWGVVWRRGSKAAVVADVSQSRKLIRDSWEREQLALAQASLLTQLKEDKLRDYNPAKLSDLRFAKKAPTKQP